ncbi:MAG: hypothetical protein ABIG45_09780 [Bacillota bacterium]
MQDDYNNPSGNRNQWDGNTAYSGDPGSEYNDYEDYGDYETYDDSDLDKELSSEHNFRIAMNVFDLISMLVGLAAILFIAALLFSLFNWVQRDISQSLSVLTAPFR